MAFKFDALNLAHFKPSASTNNFSFESLLPKSALSQPVNSAVTSEFVKGKPRLLTSLPAGYPSMTARASQAGIAAKSNPPSARLVIPGNKPNYELFKVDQHVERMFSGVENGKATHSRGRELELNRLREMPLDLRPTNSPDYFNKFKK